MSKRQLTLLGVLIILLPAIFLQGCMFFTPQLDEPTEPEEDVLFQPYLPEEPESVRPMVPGRFTLRYDPNSSLNPLTTLNRDNILLGSLLYETLFVLDPNLLPEPVLVSNWSSEDNMLFEFELKSDIAMSNGTFLTAQDAIYSVRQATRIGRFSNRLSSIASVQAVDELTFTIQLNAPNSRFVHLLDIPVIKSGTSDQRVPPGTGPFRFLSPDSMHLIAFFEHRDFADLPVSLIRLQECADTELTELFDTGALSLLWDDPHDAFEVRLNRLRETRYFETTVLQFLGFNANHIALSDPDVRRAIGISIDRQYIVENIMRPGLTLAAPLPLSPAFHLYMPQWENRHLAPLEEMARLLRRAGLNVTFEYTEGPFLELSDGLGGYTPFSIDFIVNIENTHKVQVAHHIANTLRRNGLNVVVRELPWERFNTALQNRTFDMFLGETQLGADFDLSPLLLPGPLNFGGTASNYFAHFIDDFLTARTDSEIIWAAERLIEEIEVYAPFAPILYKRHAIYSPIGVITGAQPSQSSVFRNITDWSINLMMLN